MRRMLSEARMLVGLKVSLLELVGMLGKVSLATCEDSRRADRGWRAALVRKEEGDQHIAQFLALLWTG